MESNRYNMKMGWDDPSEIDISNSWERNYWCSKLNCNNEQLAIAVNEVGPKVSKIKEFISLIKKQDLND